MRRRAGTVAAGAAALVLCAAGLALLRCLCPTVAGRFGETLDHVAQLARVGRLPLIAEPVGVGFPATMWS